ncbi:hypothetical protein EDF62_1584 [Leucobacter luti]|uniref:Dephospho-CoA kinase n=1 Tax=Leucobacter luti TaxID=340320 RepID=A0A4R6S0A8_9MICO|nr:hypothetical protein [Leucobacter luti]TDP92377.1 hypothetical protein EDF62_1584 [Leucobacter luti]
MTQTHTVHPTQLIGIGGRKRHGKDAFASLIGEQDPDAWIVTGMSVALFEAALVCDPLIPLARPHRRRWRRRLSETSPAILYLRERLRIERFKHVRLSHLVMAVGETAAKEVPEVRQFLQRLGTDVGRDMIDQDVWVRAAGRKIEQLRAQGKNVVITGIRYPNELAMVQRLGGTTFWVERPGMPVDASDSHVSEHALSLRDFDHAIMNIGTLDDLREQALSWVKIRPQETAH